jgi:hypothetical protein
MVGSFCCMASILLLLCSWLLLLLRCVGARQ